MATLEGKVALVTGSSKGIGQAIAVKLAREGADVVVHYGKSAEEAQSVAAEVRAAGRRAEVLGADVGDMQQVQKLVDDAFTKMGGVDILVNNAGVEKNAPFWEVTEKDYDLVLDVDLKAPFFATQAFVKHLRTRKRPGKVINVSSVHEDLPFPNFAAYCAAKGGLRMLTRTLAVELAPLGVTVNGIAPGAIETPMNADLLRDPRKLELLLQKIPLRRLGKPEDVAGVAAFLASSAADYVTGATYFVDGGLTYSYEEQ